MPFLKSIGFAATPLVRGTSWDPLSGELRLDRQPLDALIHLAGENIGSRRWSAEQKTRIRTSRVEATQKLAASLVKLRPPPRVFIGASAVGIYGNRGAEVLTERSNPGTAFLSQVVVEWERAAEPLVEAGVRVVHLRFGMIIGREGGALAKMLPLFKAGLGGRLGSGRQWTSWIALADVLRVIEWALKSESAAGAYNAVSPEPIINREFTRVLANVLNRPAVLPVPAPMLRLTFGEMADALLLSSQRVVPERLLDAGFKFEFKNLESALKAELELKPSGSR
jgi:uncharacterized protein (TIGR01777 family)